MLAKRILAGIFAVTILLKLTFLAVKPDLWIGAVEVLLGQQTLLTLIYLVLIALIGYYLFSTLDLLDIAVVMMFTSLLIGLTIIPYAGALLKVREEISVGPAKAWLAWLLWGALAVAVLYKVFAPGRRQNLYK